MKKRAFIGLVTSGLIVALSALLVGGCTPAAVTPTNGEPTTPEVINWKMQTTYATHSVIGRQTPWWAEQMEKITGGRLHIEVFETGTFCSPEEIPDALGRGVMDAAFTYGGYHIGTVPEAEVECGLPWSWMTQYEAWEVYFKRGGLDIIREAYAEHGIYFSLLIGDQYYHFVTNFPVTSLADMAGKKLRATGAYAAYSEAIGVATTVIPAGELYMALKLGTIDGALYSVSGTDDFNLGEVCTGFVFPTCGVPCGGFLISMKSLDALPEDLRVLVKEAATHLAVLTSLDIYRLNEVAWIKLQEQGMEKYVLPDEDVLMATGLGEDIWAESAAKCPRNAAFVELVKDMLRDYGRL